MKKVVSLILAVVLTAALFAGCGESSSEGTKDTVTILGTYSTETLNPLMVQEGMDGWVQGGLFDALVRFDENAKPQPMLAESWDEDGMDVIFHLRKGVKGHDGTEFNADDVIFTMDTRIAEPNNYFILNYVTSWEKVDDYTVKFTRTNLFTNFFEFLAANYGVSLIVSKEAYEEKGPDGFAKEPAGFGPYKLESKGTDGTVTLKAFEDYWNGKPAFETVIVKAPIDINTAIVGLENGEIDIVTNVPPSQFATVKGNDKLALDEASGLSNMELMLGGSLSKDENLRKAIAYGVNRESIITVATEGTGKLAVDDYSPYMMGDLAGTFANAPKYDPDKAAEYLAKSDYVPGTEIRFTVYDPVGVAIAQSVQNDMAKLGVTIKVDQVDYNAYGTMLVNGELEIFTRSISGVTISLADCLTYWETENPVWGPLFAHSEEYDQIISQIRTETDSAKLHELVKRGMEIEYELGNFVGLYEGIQAVAYNKTVDGVHAGTAGVYNWYPQDLKPAAN